MIYLDSAATSFYRPPCVAEAVAEASSSMGNVPWRWSGAGGIYSQFYRKLKYCH